MRISGDLLRSAEQLNQHIRNLTFSPPVCHVYNPMHYAWKGYAKYVAKYGNSRKDILFLGMNPGPWGMAQTGIPFGEITAVKNWLNIHALVDKPDSEHPKRQVAGYNCLRSEVSGRRLWGLFKHRYGTAESFFNCHFVANYCPLMFLEENGRNRTPDKLPKHEQSRLFTLCDKHLKQIVASLQPSWVVGVGGFAAECANRALGDLPVAIGRILHPSPANPSANRNWAKAATDQLISLSIW
jgi:single-strand selective monofunctional uracil DNA glycosylase